MVLGRAALSVVRWWLRCRFEIHIECTCRSFKHRGHCLPPTTVGSAASSSLELTNTGGQTLLLGGATLSDTADFAVSTNCSSSLPAGASCTYTIQFTPQAAQALDAMLTLTDNSGGVSETRQAVSLSGAGVAVPLPQVSFTPQTLAFPQTATGATSPSQTITLSNTGMAPLTIGAASLSDTMNFGESTTCSGTLAVAASCTFSVVFQPQTVGSDNATLTFTDNAGTDSGTVQQTVALSGTGLPLPEPQAVLAPGQIAFPATAVGAAPATATVTLSNTGTAALTVANVAVTDTANFGVTSACGGSVAAGASCVFTVLFHPQSAGTLGTQLAVGDNSGGTSGAQQTVMLSGTALPPPAPLAVVSPAQLAFPSTNVGATSVAQTVTLSNPGTAALAVEGMALSDAADYGLSNGCGTSLAAGGTCTAAVVFHPQSTGALPATLTLTDNGGGGGASAQQAVGLAGTGTPQPEPQIALTPMSLVFAQTTVGSTAAAQTVTVTNTGNAALNVMAALSDAMDFALANSCPASLPAGASCVLSIRFQPQVAGTPQGSLVLTDNTGGVQGTQQAVALSGTAVPPSPQALLSTGSLSFPQTGVTLTSAAQSITLSNPGSAPLMIAGMSLSDTADYSLTTNCGATLTMGASCAISVIFLPQSVSALSGTLIVTDNSGLSGAGTVQQTVTLNGTGVAFQGPRASASPGMLQFAPVVVGQTATPETVSLSNTGTQPLTITGVALGAGSASSFSLTGNDCGMALAAGASCTISVGYAPTAANPSDTGTLVISNDGLGQGGGTQTVALSGVAWAEVDSVTNFGDSITCGFYAEPQDGTGLIWSLEGYAGLLDKFLNLPINDVCRQGDEAADMSRLWVPFNSTPTLGGNQLYTAMIGANDAYVNGVPPAWLTAYGAEVGAAFGWLAIPNADKVLANTITQRTGTWTADVGFGLQSSAQGSSLTFSVTQAVTGENLYLVYHVWAPGSVQGGTASIAIDGTVQAAVQAQDPGFYGTQNGTTDTYLLTRVPLGAVGPHTVTFSSAGAVGTTVGLLWAGVPQADYRTAAGAPRVLIGAITNSPSGNQTYAANVYNIQLRSTVNSLTTDGLNLTVVPTDTVLDPGSDFVDLLHPNTGGHAKVAATFEQYR